MRLPRLAEVGHATPIVTQLHVLPEILFIDRKTMSLSVVTIVITPEWTDDRGMTKYGKTR